MILRLELHVVPSRTRVQLQAAVEEQRWLADQAQKAAGQDELTGLARRWRFDEEIERQVADARRYGTPGTLVLIDVDGLKSVNDTLGHQAGDDVPATCSGLDPNPAASNRHRLREDVNRLVRLGLAREREEAQAAPIAPFSTPTLDSGPPLLAIDDVEAAIANSSTTCLAVWVVGPSVAAAVLAHAVGAADRRGTVPAPMAETDETSWLEPTPVEPLTGHEPFSGVGATVASSGAGASVICRPTSFAASSPSSSWRKPSARAKPCASPGTTSTWPPLREPTSP